MWDKVIKISSLPGLILGGNGHNEMQLVIMQYFCHYAVFLLLNGFL